jgi:hypothetical protein
MNKQLDNSKYANGQFESEVMGNIAIDEKYMIKIRQSGDLVYIDPPPDDKCCEICGRRAEDLETFDQEFCEAAQHFENKAENLLPNCIIKFITADHKLGRDFRSFYQEQAVTSWECKNCILLSDEEVIERILEHS